MDGALACWLYLGLSSLAKSMLLVDPNPCFRYEAKMNTHHCGYQSSLEAEQVVGLKLLSIQINKWSRFLAA